MLNTSIDLGNGLTTDTSGLLQHLPHATGLVNSVTPPSLSSRSRLNINGGNLSAGTASIVLKSSSVTSNPSNSIPNNQILTIKTDSPLIISNNVDGGSLAEPSGGSNHQMSNLLSSNSSHHSPVNPNWNDPPNLFPSSDIKISLSSHTPTSFSSISTRPASAIDSHYIFENNLTNGMHSELPHLHQSESHQDDSLESSMLLPQQSSSALSYSARGAQFSNQSRSIGSISFQNGIENGILYPPVTINSSGQFENGPRPNSIPGTGMGARMSRIHDPDHRIKPQLSEPLANKILSSSNGNYDMHNTYNGLDRSELDGSQSRKRLAFFTSNTQYFDLSGNRVGAISSYPNDSGGVLATSSLLGQTAPYTNLQDVGASITVADDNSPSKRPRS